MEVDRFFSARHAYVRPGTYDVRVTLIRADREVAAARTFVRILGRVASRSW